MLTMNDKLIVNLLEKIIGIGNELINEELRQQLLDGYMNLQQTYRADSPALNYLLAKYGLDIKQMIK